VTPSTTQRAAEAAAAQDIPADLLARVTVKGEVLSAGARDLVWPDHQDAGKAC
jgi:hypothetical protein